MIDVWKRKALDHDDELQIEHTKVHNDCTDTISMITSMSDRYIQV